MYFVLALIDLETYRYLTMNYSDYKGLKHHCLTKGEATRFVIKDWQVQEATEFAGRTFKRLMYFTCDHPVFKR